MTTDLDSTPAVSLAGNELADATRTTLGRCPASVHVVSSRAPDGAALGATVTASPGDPA